MVIFIVTIKKKKKRFLKIWQYFLSILALFIEFQGRSLDWSGSNSRIIMGIIVGFGCYSAQSVHQAIMTSFKHFLPNLSFFQRTKISNISNLIFSSIQMNQKKKKNHSSSCTKESDPL
jgi:hypothetical protein